MEVDQAADKCATLLHNLCALCIYAFVALDKLFISISQFETQCFSILGFSDDIRNFLSIPAVQFVILKVVFEFNR